jgi:hypothetical protein
LPSALAAGEHRLHPRILGAGHSYLARRAIQCLIDLQQQAGCNSLIGRRLYPLLARAGYREVRVSPRMVYTDATRPSLADGFTRKTSPPWSKESASKPSARE